MTFFFHMHHNYRLVQVKLLWLQASLGKTLQQCPVQRSGATTTQLSHATFDAVMSILSIGLYYEEMTPRMMCHTKM